MTLLQMFYAVFDKSYLIQLFHVFGVSIILLLLRIFSPASNIYTLILGLLLVGVHIYLAIKNGFPAMLSNLSHILGTGPILIGIGAGLLGMSYMTILQIAVLVVHIPLFLIKFYYPSP